MRRTIAICGFVLGLLALNTAAYAECTTITTYIGGKMVICSVCCTPGATCTQVCS